MLRLVFRYVVTERSTAWIYDHRVEWDRPLAGDVRRHANVLDGDKVRLV